MDIYLDINGVLTTQNHEPAPHITEFLKYVTEKHTCFWLTTHCKGNSGPCIEYLRPIISSQALWYAEKLLPTDWKTLKTEAIMWDRDFRWIDDLLFEGERKALGEHLAFDKFIPVDLKRNAGQLLEIIRSL